MQTVPYNNIKPSRTHQFVFSSAFSSAMKPICVGVSRKSFEQSMFFPQKPPLDIHSDEKLLCCCYIHLGIIFFMTKVVKLKSRLPFAVRGKAWILRTKSHSKIHQQPIREPTQLNNLFHPHPKPFFHPLKALWIKIAFQNIQ